MNRSSLLLSSLTLAAAIGCGSIDHRDGSLAQVTGRLSGSAPAGAHVALVWRVPTGGLAVGADAPVVNGAFVLHLAGAPNDAWFATVFGETSDDPPSVTAAAPSTSGAQGGGVRDAGTSSSPNTSSPSSSGSSGSAQMFASMGSGLGIRTDVSGTVASALSIAAAGFVLYVDANGNGQLDLTDERGSSPDTIVGGSKDLALTYLRDGTALDLEKLANKGTAPSRGYNLYWFGGDRWLSPSNVELTLGVHVLPSAICRNETSVDYEDGTSDSSSLGVPVGSASVTCAPDGRSYSVGCGAVGASATTTPALCDGSSESTSPCQPIENALASGTPVSADWPCPVSGDDTAPPHRIIDAGAPSVPDAGI